MNLRPIVTVAEETSNDRLVKPKTLQCYARGVVDKALPMKEKVMKLDNRQNFEYAIAWK